MNLASTPVTRPLVMGIVNVTPDSFSDGGRHDSPELAVAHGRELVRAGADVLDVGGESTRPGALRPSEDEELRRVVPVVAALAADGATVSVDTMRARVAEAAIEAGATIVNDVSGGLADPEMAPLVAARGVEFVAMHWRGHSRDMQARAEYDDVVEDVRRDLAERVDALVAAGVALERLIIDPGLGFGKTAAHNWALLARLDRLLDLGPRVLVGASRKNFLGLLEADGDGSPNPPDRRDAATAATSYHCAQAGVWAVRVHDVATTVSALRVHQALGAARLAEERGGHE